MSKKDLRTGDLVTVKIDRVSNNENIIAKLPSKYKRNTIHVHNGAVGELASVEITDVGSPLKGEMIEIIDKAERRYNKMSVRKQISHLNEKNDSTDEVTDPRLSDLDEDTEQSDKSTISELIQERKAERLKESKKNREDETDIKHNIVNKKL